MFNIVRKYIASFPIQNLWPPQTYTFCFKTQFKGSLLYFPNVTVWLRFIQCPLIPLAKISAYVVICSQVERCQKMTGMKLEADGAGLSGRGSICASPKENLSTHFLLMMSFTQQDKHVLNPERGGRGGGGARKQVSLAEWTVYFAHGGLEKKEGSHWVNSHSFSRRAAPDPVYIQIPHGEQAVSHKITAGAASVKWLRSPALARQSPTNTKPGRTLRLCTLQCADLNGCYLWLFTKQSLVITSSISLDIVGHHPIIHNHGFGWMVGGRRLSWIMLPSCPLP